MKSFEENIKDNKHYCLNVTAPFIKLSLSKSTKRIN